MKWTVWRLVLPRSRLTAGDITNILLSVFESFRVSFSGFQLVPSSWVWTSKAVKKSVRAATLSLVRAGSGSLEARRVLDDIDLPMSAKLTHLQPLLYPEKSLLKGAGKRRCRSCWLKFSASKLSFHHERERILLFLIVLLTGLQYNKLSDWILHHI
jgi:hypothetical protein